MSSREPILNKSHTLYRLSYPGRVYCLMKVAKKSWTILRMCGGTKSFQIFLPLRILLPAQALFDGLVCFTSSYMD